MKRHTVEMSELEQWLRTPCWKEFAGSYSKTSDKSLEVDVGGGVPAFKVTDHGETIFLGADMRAAVAAYNSAQ